ncbi:MULTISPECIES: hypothetical protein [Cysteiniphilum]|uniref:Uncharacterized protein n=1 Tax=Cysteiniphilum litorale TaxID=2056700 RepID=A0A8J2Z383_9GAMM|nr:MULTISPECIES: hypothetical protein [Cysteiniphilum]GGF92532.1 hypothetical protein GCM10010995_07100 [Cysteiniphilum litorale]
MNNHVDTMNFNLTVDHDPVEIIDGIIIKPIKLEEHIELKHKIPILIKIHNADWQILNLPQEITQHYPVVIHAKPRTVIYGRYNAVEHNFTLTVAAKYSDGMTKKKVLMGVVSIFSLNILPVLRKSRRMIGNPFSYSFDIGSDIWKMIKAPKHTNNTIGGSFADMSERDAKKYSLNFSCLAIFIIMIPLIMYLLSLIMDGHFSYYAFIVIPFCLIPLYMRYQCKYRKKVTISRFLIELCKGRGI